MNDLEFNSNETCQYLYASAIVTHATNIVLLRTILSMVKQLNPGTNEQSLHDGLLSAVKMLVPQVSKLFPLSEDTISDDFLNKILSLLKDPDAGS